MEEIYIMKRRWLEEQLAKLAAQGISKAEIARRLEIAPQSLNNVLNGARGISDSFLDKFIAAFNISHYDLYPSKESKEAAEVLTIPKDLVQMFSDMAATIRSQQEELRSLRSNT